MLSLVDNWPTMEAMDSDVDSLEIDLVELHQLAEVIVNRVDNVLIIDSRSFLEYNTSHISYAVNVNCSKIVKRRLQQNKVCAYHLHLSTH